MNSSLQFKFPVDLTVPHFIAKLNEEVDSQLASQQRRTKTYYDSFDWRLYSSGMICEFFSSKLTLKSAKNNLLIASTKLNKVPKFSQQFDYGQVRHQLEPILEMRALLPICTINYQIYQIHVINEDQKIMLRLAVEEYEQFTPRVFLQILKGYEKIAEDVVELLTSQLGLTATTKPILLAALKHQGRKVNDYCSKMTVNLEPNTRADIAGNMIYSQLLKIIRDNEQGTIDDIDSEFLHDFRVAVRRTRSALSQLKQVLPNDVTVYYANFFSWLGKITSETRDLDVYLLNFERYKNSLPIEIRDHLNPLYDFLHKKQRQAQQELAKELRSIYYLSTLAEWELYLKDSPSTHIIAANAKLTIKQLADKRLWKNYRRVLREGAAITEQSPSEALHELRKSCKKLRYLVEFFQSLYAKNKIKTLLKALKELQEVLGDYQDCAVQKSNLQLFSAEMREMKTTDETFLAIERLIQNLDAHQQEIRSHFALKFEAFTQEETPHTFKSLFD